MLHARLSRLALLAVICCLVPTTGSAQVGGFLKNKLKQKVKGDSATQQPSKSAPGPSFDEYVLQLTPPNLDRLERAVAAEKAFRDSARAAHAHDRTEKEWDRCRMDVMRSPEARALSQNAPTDPAGFQKQQQQFEALNQKKCGGKPEAYDPKQELKTAAVAGAKSVGLTPVQYSVMKERIGPFCAAPAARIPGENKEMFYVYAADEMSALQARCPKLAALLAAVGAGPTGSAPVGPTFDENRLELTPEVLQRLEKYYATRVSSRAAAAAPTKTRQEWQQCSRQFMMGPEGQAVMRSGGNDPQAMNAKINAAIVEKCGPNPNDVRRGARPQAAAEVAGLTTSQVRSAAERIESFCGEYGSGGRPPSAQTKAQFTPAELKALPPRCGTLLPAIQKDRQSGT